MRKNYRKYLLDCSTNGWKGMKPGETRKLVNKFFNDNIEGKKVLNIDKGILINFNKSGGKKIAFGGSIYPKKAALLPIILQIVKYAEYSNFGKAKSTDATGVIGYLNFKCQVLIDDKKEKIRFSVQLRIDGKFYYNHEVNIYKKYSIKN